MYYASRVLCLRVPKVTKEREKKKEGNRKSKERTKKEGKKERYEFH